MKKVFTLLSFTLTLIALQGQSISGVINIDKPLDIKLNTSFIAGVTTDTIYEYINRATSFPVYSGASRACTKLYTAAGFSSGARNLYG